MGEGGDAGAFPDDDEFLVGTKPELVERARVPPDTILFLGGEEDDAARAIGEVARMPFPNEPLDDRDGDTARFCGGDVVRAADVA